MTGVAQSLVRVSVLASLALAGAAQGKQERAGKEAATPNATNALPGNPPVTSGDLTESGELAVGVSMRGRPKAVFGEAPRVAILRDELVAQKASDEFPALKAAAIQVAAPFLKDPVKLPDGPGAWSFDYANPLTGTRLEPVSPTEHRDPKTGEIFSDERTLAAYRTRLHYRAEEAALALAWAYAWSDEEQYAQEVRRILLKLAADYPGYPPRVDRWGRRGFFARWGGRRYVQSLDEATGVISLAKAYDLTRGSSVYSEAERQRIERDFFRATADTLLRFNQGIINHQTWYNAGLMHIAGVLGDAALAERVVQMRGGYLDQLRRSVGSDGLWWEGALAYHLYALKAMTLLVEAAERYGLPLAGEPKLRTLFTAPLPMAFPDGSLPAINDSDPLSLNAFRKSWEWAWDQWRDPLYQQLLTQPLERVLSQQTSRALPDAGLAILRRGTGADARIAYLDYGPHGGGHGHFDKLNIILYANGREWLLDPGRLSYSTTEYSSWVKTTAAHNTVVIDERNQYPVQGRLLYLEEKPGYTAAGAEVRGAYEGTLLRRHLVLTDRFLVDTVEVLAPRRGTIDLLAHARAERLEAVGETQSAESVESAQRVELGKRDGYSHFSPAYEAPAGVHQWRFVASEGGPVLGVHLLPEEGERVIISTGIGYTREEKTPTLIRRRFVRSTTYITVYDLSGSSTGVLGIRPLPKGDRGEQGIVVRTAEGEITVRQKQDGVEVK